MIQSKPSLNGCIYEIIILGELNEQWSSWFNGMHNSSRQKDNDTLETHLIVRVPDQARLRGILNKIWDLNLTIISLVRIEELEVN